MYCVLAYLHVCILTFSVKRGIVCYIIAHTLNSFVHSFQQWTPDRLIRGLSDLFKSSHVVPFTTRLLELALRTDRPN